MLATVAPSAVEYVPVPQELQVLSRGAPDALENFPAEHAWHVPGVLAITSGEYRPAEQARQVPVVPAPLEVEYVPAGQAVQGWGTGGCWGIHTSRLLVSGPLYVIAHEAPPDPSTCSTRMENTPAEKLILEQTLLGLEFQRAVIVLTPLILRDATSSLIIHTLYVPADTMVRLSEYVVEK